MMLKDDSYQWIWVYEQLQSYLDETQANKMMGNIANKLNNDIKDVIRHIFDAVDRQNIISKLKELLCIAQM